MDELLIKKQCVICMMGLHRAVQLCMNAHIVDIEFVFGQ